MGAAAGVLTSGNRAHDFSLEAKKKENGRLFGVKFTEALIQINRMCGRIYNVCAILRA